MTVAERSKVDAFVGAYRRGFEAFDVDSLADLFSYPCLITADADADADAVAVTVVSSRDAWIGQLERLVAAYRAIAVRSTQVLDLHVTELTPRLAQATVQWALTEASGARIYDFAASYTLADVGRGMRITAIAHNEAARLRAAVARQRDDR